MTHLLIPFIILIIIALTHYKGDKNRTDENKAITQLSLKFIVAIFFSIIVSIFIALNADMPDNIGFGGFIYIIGPGMIGLLIMFVYVISLGIRPKWKTILGVLSILINIVVGFYYMLFVK